MRIPGGLAAWASVAVLLAAISLPGREIPPWAPFSGDNGIRLWQAQAFIEGTEALPRALPPGVGSRMYPPALSIPCDGGVASSYPASFPLVSSLFGAGSLGSSRLFVLIATASAAWPLAVLAAGGAAAGIGAIAGICAFALSGMAPYALVFWEHGPAMLPALLWVLMFMSALGRRGRLPFWTIPLAAAAVWRPEIAPAAAGASVALVWSARREEGARSAILVWAAAAILAGLAMLVPGALPERIVDNLPCFVPPGRFLQARLSILSSWTVPAGNIPAVAACLAWAIAAVMPDRLAAKPAVRAAAVSAALVLLYYWYRKSLGSSSIFMMAPGLALFPLTKGFGECPAAARMEKAGGGAAAALLLLSPTDGMFQFGPRFLLLPAALLAASFVRRCLPRHPGGALLLASAAVVSVAGSVRGVLFENYFRSRHAQLAACILAVPEGTAVATDEEWMPITAWKASEQTPVLFMDHPPAGGVVSGTTAVWLSGRSVATGEASASGYRGLRWSGPGAASLAPPPGDPLPNPWDGIP